MSRALLLCLAVALPLAAFAAIDADEIMSLPGLTGEMTSKQYSGYLSIPGGKHLHYWLVTSEKDPETDPVAVWLNGGPGCSSMDGYFYEQGPYHVVEPIPAGQDPTLYLNPNRWNQVANMLYIEMPAGVGFSYADTPAGYDANDTSQAIDNWNAVQVFFKGFPELADNDFYISGESYAGMYVPTLAMRILDSNKAGTTDINLKGILVGNGVTGMGSQNGLPILENFLFGHGLYSQAAHEEITTECGDLTPPVTTACQNALTVASTEVSKINIYDIYTPCINAGFKPEVEHASHYNNPLNSRAKRVPVTKEEELLLGAGIQGPVECIDAGAASVYLNQAAVRTAIHVKPASQIGNWTICTNKVKYTFTMGSLLPYYKNDIIPYIRVIIYNGDVDSCVPYNGNELWTSSLNIPIVQGWRAWFVNEQVAGYATTYESNFQFVTVKGSGHMVPQYRPVQALALFEHFINDTPF